MSYNAENLLKQINNLFVWSKNKCACMPNDNSRACKYCYFLDHQTGDDYNNHEELYRALTDEFLNDMLNRNAKNQSLNDES